MGVRITGLCIPANEEQTLVLLNTLFQIKKPGYELRFIEMISFPDLILDKDPDTADLFSEGEISIVFVHSDLLKEDLFERIPEENEYLFFQINETSMVHRFCRQGDRNRLTELGILDFGNEKKFIGENFLSVEQNENVFFDVLPRAFQPYLNKNFHELPVETQAKRFHLVIKNLEPPQVNPPSSEPLSEKAPVETRKSIPLQKVSFVNNISMNLRFTIVKNYFKDVGITLNPNIPEDAYPACPHWQRWNLSELEQNDFKWRMLLFSGTGKDHETISKNTWFFDPEWDHGYTPEAIAGKLNTIAGTEPILKKLEYNEANSSCMYYAGEQIELWQGQLNTTKDYFSLLKNFGKSLNGISNEKKFYFLPDSRNGLIVYLSEKQASVLRDQLAIGKKIELLENISDQDP